MVLKFYLHNATTGDTGTLPATTASISGSVPTKIASGTNRSMDATIGVAQTSVALTTNANQVGQPSLIARFCSAPIAAQTIASQAFALHAASSMSSALSAF